MLILQNNAPLTCVTMGSKRTLHYESRNISETGKYIGTKLCRPLPAPFQTRLQNIMSVVLVRRPRMTSECRQFLSISIEMRVYKPSFLEIFNNILTNLLTIFENCPSYTAARTLWLELRQSTDRTSPARERPTLSRPAVCAR